MKKKLLLFSVISSSLATLAGLVAVFLPTQNLDHILTASKLLGAAGIFGALGIALFFVGWVFPRD